MSVEAAAWDSGAWDSRPLDSEADLVLEPHYFRGWVVHRDARGILGTASFPLEECADVWDKIEASGCSVRLVL